MNYIKHLTGFFNRISIEESINPTHISLYIAIFQFWNLNRFTNPVLISREEVMKISKINSNATYHKCIKDLERLGFLKYNPSYNPHSGTSITVNHFTQSKKAKTEDNMATSSKNELVHNLTLSKSDNVNEQVHIYNNKTSINNKNNIYRSNENLEFLEALSEQAEQSAPMSPKGVKKEKSSAKKEKLVPKVFYPGETNPSLELVKEYFNFQKNSEFEAERFFNYYSSNGWLIGGKTKMEDWKASARNWMLNTKKFAANIPKNIAAKEIDRAQHLQTNNDKDYSEPL